MAADPQIRTWTLHQSSVSDTLYFVASPGRDAVERGGKADWPDSFRVVEAAPVIAALHQIEAAIHIGKGLALHEVQELRRAVSDA